MLSDMAYYSQMYSQLIRENMCSGTLPPVCHNGKTQDHRNFTTETSAEIYKISMTSRGGLEKKGGHKHRVRKIQVF